MLAKIRADVDAARTSLRAQVHGHMFDQFIHVFDQFVHVFDQFVYVFEPLYQMLCYND